MDSIGPRYRKNIFFGVGFSRRLLILAIFFALSVAGASFSIYLLLIANSAYMYLIAILFLVLSFITGSFNTYAAYLYYKSYFYMDHMKKVAREMRPMSVYPKVCVIVPIKNEDSRIVKRTLAGILSIDYPRKKLDVILSDTSDATNRSSTLESFCRSNGIRYISGKSINGKAGSLNVALRQVDAEFVAVFDYDEKIVRKGFLKELLPYFQDEKIGYIQTEKSYFKGSFFSQTVDLFDKFFFNFIEPARAINNTAIYAGSCGIIRKSVLDKVGGFPEYVTEDTFFSFEACGLGYKSMYVPVVYAKGIQVKSFSALAKQQWRYNFGDTEFMRYYVGEKKNIRGSVISHIDYVMHGMGLSYISVMLISFTVLSVLIVFSAASITHISLLQMLNLENVATDLEIIGSSALFLSIFAPVIMTKVYFGSFKKGLMLFALNYALAVTRTMAAISVFTKKNPFAVWSRQKTSKKGSILYSLVSTRLELLFAGIVLIFSYLALSASNILGGFWLAWYGIMYGLATLFVYKYG